MTLPAEYAELVRRLLATAGKGQCGPLKAEAAAAIEKLVAERTRRGAAICCYCDNDLSCGSCGHEQPDDSAEWKKLVAERDAWHESQKANAENADDQRLRAEAAEQALAAERERCAKIVEAECDRILSKQSNEKNPFGFSSTIDLNLRMMASPLPGIAAKIRAADVGSPKDNGADQ